MYCMTLFYIHEASVPNAGHEYFHSAVYCVSVVPAICLFCLFMHCTLLQDMLCFTGGGFVSVKANNFPIHQQRQSVSCSRISDVSVATAG